MCVPKATQPHGWLPPVTVNDVQKLHCMIECCLLNNLNALETEATLHKIYGISPCITRIVWQKLEESNPEFFEDSPLSLRACLPQATQPTSSAASSVSSY
jgi:uncharacterized protein (TIGR01589 family)